MNCMRSISILLLSVGVVPLPAAAGHELENRNLLRGAELYQNNCAACHGANLEGQPDWQVAGPDGILPAPPHDETGHTWHHDNGLLFDYTRLGGQEALAMRGITGFRSGMPAFDGTLSDDEIWDVLAYIRSTWPERVRAIQASRNPPHAD
jgi:mono/diheme cytochrome c family protein